MPREFVVRTPENVEITHSLAGIGSRFAAILIDHLIQMILFLFLVLIVLVLLGGVRDWFAFIDDLAHLSGWLLAGLFLGYFLIFWGYFIIFETVWNGQSPGKRMMDLRVVKENGSPVDFFSAAIRNIVRIIDMMPTGYAVGIISMFFSPAYKRLGDYAAGTVVVKEYRAPSIRPTRRRAGKGSPLRGEEPAAATLETVHDGEEPDYHSGVSIIGINQVSREEYDAARRFLDRRGELPGDVAASFARRIAEPILTRLDMTPNDPDDYSYEQFLETLARDYLRWQDRGF